MNLNEQVLEIILKNPGTSKKILAERFGLSLYRLNRLFRHIERDLNGRTLVHDDERGVWIVRLDDSKCLGMEWMGFQQGGYRQCDCKSLFQDGRCYEHSGCEDIEMVAFNRKLDFLAGPGDPTARSLSQLTMEVVRDLMANLERIIPITRRNLKNKLELLKILSAACVALKWKEKMRRQPTEGYVPHEFAARSGQSSVNPFEYSLKKYFAELEIPFDSDKDQVLKAWKRLALCYHPDVMGSDGDEEKMKAINLAKDSIFRVKRWD